MCRSCGAYVFPLWGPWMPVIKGRYSISWLTQCAPIFLGRSGSKFQGILSGPFRFGERFFASLDFGAEPLLGCQVSWCYFRERWKRSSRLETRAKEFRAGASPRACPNPKGEMKVNVLRAAGLVLDTPGLGMTDPATRSRLHACSSEMEHQL